MTSLINLCKEPTGLVAEGRVVDTVYLCFRKAFDIILHKILLCELLIHGAGWAESEVD